MGGITSDTGFEGLGLGAWGGGVDAHEPFTHLSMEPCGHVRQGKGLWDMQRGVCVGSIVIMSADTPSDAACGRLHRVTKQW